MRKGHPWLKWSPYLRNVRKISIFLCSPLLMGLPFSKIKKHMWESVWLQLKCYDMGTLNLGNIEEHRGTLKTYFEWHTARLRNASTFWGSNSPHLEVIGGACGHSLAQITIAVGDSMVYHGIPIIYIYNDPRIRDVPKYSPKDKQNGECYSLFLPFSTSLSRPFLGEEGVGWWTQCLRSHGAGRWSSVHLVDRKKVTVKTVVAHELSHLFL